MDLEGTFPTPPEHLFKYRSLADATARQRLEQILLGGVLHFAPFNKLNDPLEGLIEPDFSSPPVVIRAYWTERLDHLPLQPGEDAVAAIERYVGWSKGPEAQARLREEVLAILSTAGVFCMAGTSENDAMWTQYADNHKGVCLRFQVDARFVQWAFAGGVFGQMHYSNDFRHFKFYETSDPEKVRALYLAKGTEWRHEDEWRIVRTELNGAVKFPPQNLDAIVVGRKISRDDRAFVESLVARRPITTAILDG